MLDIKFIRENAEQLKLAVKNKNVKLDLDELLDVDKKRNALQAEIEALHHEKNQLAETGKRAKPTAAQISKGKQTKEKIAKKEQQLEGIQKQYGRLMAMVPTVPSPDTPVGKDDSGNVEISRSGTIPHFDFEPKDYLELGKRLDIVDTERGVKVSGYRGYYLKNEGALLVMALMMYALDTMVKKGYKPMIPPTLVKQFALFGTGYFKGEEYDSETDEIYQVSSSDKEATGEYVKDKKFLVGTAEPSLLAYFSGEVLKEEDLPIKVCGFSQCYRSEIGSYSKDTKGIYRVHEFMKVEQVVVSKADVGVSTSLQEEMIAISAEMLHDLGLPYRKIQICTGDMAPGKYRAFDLEAWLPGSRRWAEMGSASNFLDWQARRLNVKYVAKNGEKKVAYLLNNTALSSLRPFIAILENHQQKDGSVKIPKALAPFMHGISKIDVKN